MLPVQVLALLSLVSSAYAYYRGGPIYGNNFGIPGRNQTYDYVIVGGGTGGLALAARLAENTSHTVAVIEAGGFYEVDNGNISAIPNLGLVYSNPLSQSTTGYPTVDWGLATTNQTGLMGQQYHYWRGKTLGGSSALNNEVYHRGSLGYYEKWAEMVNDSSYSFEEFLPYFRKSMHYTAPQTGKRPGNASVPEPDPDAYSPDGGPLEVGYINYPLPFGSWAKLAFQEMGFNETSDFNHGDLVGYYQYLTQTIAPDMIRSSSQASYLDWAIVSARQNLQTYTRTLAKRIIFDNNMKAIGVEVDTFGIPYIISAKREVILTAGAIHSPQLLMVSGIGPASTLQNLSIPLLVDLPGVGQNLWDHILWTVTYRVNLQQGGSLQNPTNFIAAATEYRTNRTGPLTNTGFDFVAWEKLPAASRANLSETALSDLASFPSDWPELEFIIGDASNPNDTNSYTSVIGALVTPMSRGYVTIVSNDTADLPIFDPEWLSHPTDQEVAVQAFRRCREVFGTSAVQPILIGEEFVPGAAVQTDEEILAFLKLSVTTVYHASCTCKMGTTDDEMAVIDSQARVFGTKGLRVVDASSFPMLLPGHPSGTIYALAEKIADDILTGR